MSSFPSRPHAVHIVWRQPQGPSRTGGAGKTPVFSLLRRGGRVYTKIIPDVSSATMFPVVVQKNVPDSIAYTDDWRRPVWAWVPNISNAWFDVNRSLVGSGLTVNLNSVDQDNNQDAGHDGDDSEKFLQCRLFLEEKERRYKCEN